MDGHCDVVFVRIGKLIHLDIYKTVFASFEGVDLETGGLSNHYPIIQLSREFCESEFHYANLNNKHSWCMLQIFYGSAERNIKADPPRALWVSRRSLSTVVRKNFVGNVNILWVVLRFVENSNVN